MRSEITALLFLLSCINKLRKTFPYVGLCKENCLGTIVPANLHHRLQYFLPSPLRNNTALNFKLKLSIHFRAHKLCVIVTQDLKAELSIANYFSKPAATV